MKKTIMPTRFQHVNRIYLMGVLKNLTFTIIFNLFSFLLLAALLSFTGFSEKYMETGVIVLSALCFVLGSAFGTFFHRKKLLNTDYAINEKRINLYLVCNFLYSLILYVLIMLFV